MKILIADKLSDRALDDLNSMGAEIAFEPDLTADQIPERLNSAEILIVRSTKVGAKALEAGENLSLVIRAGAGVNTIDLERASSLGIHVANCPGKNADAVAELAIGLMIALDRHILDSGIDLRNGIWNKKKYGKARGLRGKIMGIAGMGSIGQKTAHIARALGMSVCAWSRSLTLQKAESLGVTYCSSLTELAASSDVVSVHLAAGSETRHIINKTFLDALRPGSFLINTSRGEVVDTNALVEAIRSKGIKAALDVYEDEPGASEKDFTQVELASLITGTHHIGASTNQASEAIADEVVRIVRNYVESGKPVNLVNARERSSAPHKLVVRHYNKVGVLAGVLDQLRNASINIEEMENSIFSGGTAAVCTLVLDSRPEEQVLQAIGEHPDIIQVEAK